MTDPVPERVVFQWWRLRWYWPDRKAAGQGGYKIRLLYTGRTVRRLTGRIESLKRVIDRQSAEISRLRDQIAATDRRPS